MGEVVMHRLYKAAGECFSGVIKGVTKLKDLWIESGDEKIRAWLFGEGKSCVVMAHGFGAVKDGLVEYAKLFAERFSVLLFDYRHFGRSPGEPRQLIDVKKQLEDWRNAVNYARGKFKKVALWGTSFSGGHAIVTAAAADVDAVVAQVPFVDGLACVRAAGLKSTLTLTLAGLVDVLTSMFGRSYTLPIVSEPGEAAFMNTADSTKYLKLIPETASWKNATPARVALQIPFYRPIKYVNKITCPVLYVIAEKDAITPAYATYRAAKMTRRAEVYSVDCGHFDVYLDRFRECAEVEIEYLSRFI